jgi:hypothetical protein
MSKAARGHVHDHLARTKVCPKSYATALVKPRISIVEALLKISVRITNQQGFIAKFPAYLH